MAVIYQCSGRKRGVCDHEAEEKWVGRCPQCGRAYNIIRKGADEEGGTSKTSLAALGSIKPPPRISTGIPEFDKVLGGNEDEGYGLVKGNVVLLTGEPGKGKSTLLLQAASGIATGKKTVLYTSGEQNRDDIGLMASRIGILNMQVEVAGNQGDIYEIVELAEEKKPTVLVVDSVQVAFMDDIEADVGSPTQVKAVANYLTSFAKQTKIAVLLIGHVDKFGELAGPRTLEHEVDAVIRIDGYYGEGSVDDEGAPDPDVMNVRVLSSGKNRNGASNVTSMLEMTPKGLQPLSRTLMKKFSRLEILD